MMSPDALSRDRFEDRLARAEAACARRGARLTDVRRTVLKLILEAQEPIGAYALLDRLKNQSGHGKPPTIYRALDFLLGQGLIHRVERLNAFVGCHEEADRPHPVQFLICGTCGAVTEFEDAAVSKAVESAAGKHDFRVARTIVEVEGECSPCSHAKAKNANQAAP
jgi:Fur family zinc uptake transcriptional regulator